MEVWVKWMDEGMGGQLDGVVGEETNRGIEGLLNAGMDGGIGGQLDEGVHGDMGGHLDRGNEREVHGCLDKRMDGERLLGGIGLGAAWRDGAIGEWLDGRIEGSVEAEMKGWVYSLKER